MADRTVSPVRVMVSFSSRPFSSLSQSGVRSIIRMAGRSCWGVIPSTGLRRWGRRPPSIEKDLALLFGRRARVWSRTMVIRKHNSSPVAVYLARYFRSLAVVGFARDGPPSFTVITIMRWWSSLMPTSIAGRWLFVTTMFFIRRLITAMILATTYRPPITAPFLVRFLRPTVTMMLLVRHRWLPATTFHFVGHPVPSIMAVMLWLNGFWRLKWEENCSNVRENWQDQVLEFFKNN